jgi:dual specificity phosphatase 12
MDTQPSLIYSCRRCRCALFRDTVVSLHEIGAHGFSYRRAHKGAGGGGVGGATLSSDGSSPAITCTSYFLSEALVWMSDASTDVEGKLNCPGCACRLGTLSWVGSQCSCGTWVTPAIQILKKYVEERTESGGVASEEVLQVDEQGEDATMIRSGAL